MRAKEFITEIGFLKGAVRAAKIGMSALSGKGIDAARADADIAQEKKDAEKDEEAEKLKSQAWNLKRVPLFAKEQIIKMIEDKSIEASDLRPDFIAAVSRYRKDIKKTWPKELKKFVFERLKIG